MKESCSIMQIFDTLLPNSVPLRTTVTWYLFLLQWELIIVCEFFTSRNMTLGIDEDFFLPLDTSDFCVAIRLKSTEQYVIPLGWLHQTNNMQHTNDPFITVASQEWLINLAIPPRLVASTCKEMHQVMFLCEFLSYHTIDTQISCHVIPS